MSKNFRGGYHPQEFSIWSTDCNIIGAIRWPSLDE